MNSIPKYSKYKILIEDEKLYSCYRVCFFDTVISYEEFFQDVENLAFLRLLNLSSKFDPFELYDSLLRMTRNK